MIGDDVRDVQGNHCNTEVEKQNAHVCGTHGDLIVGPAETQPMTLALLHTNAKGAFVCEH